MPRKAGIVLAVLAWLAAFQLTALRAQDSPVAGEYKPPPPPEQPIAYSHKAHLAQGLACKTCHDGAETEDHAKLPATATCMGCHKSVKTDSPEIQKLAAYDSKPEDVPWKRVYKVPTYVTFSHRVHLAKSLDCETCHGNVREMQVMQKVKDISMAACMQCHKERDAPVRCDACHEPR
jgi:Cytochrome c7 and related cytochrome c